MEALKFCSRCGATVIRPRNPCQRCGHAIDWPPPEPDAPGDHVVIVTPPARESQFSLKTLFIVVTGLCIWLAIMAAYPTAGVILAIVALFLVAAIGVFQRARRPPDATPAAFELPAELFIRTFGLPALALITVVVIIWTIVAGGLSLARRLLGGRS